MIKRFLFLACGTILAFGCTPLGVATGVGAGIGISAAQEGGVRRAVDDAVIQTKINELWFQKDLQIFTKLDLTVSNGTVLITGVVQDPEHRVEAVRMAWQPVGVKRVINEIRVADSQGIPGFIRDSWITSRIRSAITLDRDVQSLNYSIDTVQGIVYLMGFAQNQVELNRVMETARTIPNVKQVISYVKIVEKPTYDETAQTYQESPSTAPSVSQNPAGGYGAAPLPAQGVDGQIDNSAYTDGGY